MPENQPRDTSPRNLAELDEFDLHDLALLAPGPDDVRRVAPDWELRRDEFVADGGFTGARAARQPRRWVRHLAVAAAAAAVIGAGAYGMARPHEAIPAAPVTTAPASPASATIDGNRAIASGHHLRRRLTEVDRADQTSSPQTSHRTEALGADGRVWLWIDMQAAVSGEQWQRPDLAHVPSEPGALYAWLAAGHGSTATPAATPSASAPSSERVWGTTRSLLTDIGTSRDLRRALVAMAPRIPGTTVTRQGGQTVLVHTSTVPNETNTGTVLLTATLRLDDATLDLRQEDTDQVTTGAHGAKVHFMTEQRTLGTVQDLTGNPAPEARPGTTVSDPRGIIFRGGRSRKRSVVNPTPRRWPVGR